MEIVKTLHLTLTRKWFDMVKSGEKREEYRETKTYWKSRLCTRNERGVYLFKPFTHVEFRNGYGKNLPYMRFKITELTVGIGDPKLGAPLNKNVFIIKFE